MYLEHFGFREFPFALTPDTTFFLNSYGYRDALNVLLVALRSGEGFVTVVGEVGTGKTLLCRKLLNTLGEGFTTAYLHNPFLTPNALLQAVVDELIFEPFEASVSPTEPHRLLKQLNERLMELNRQGQRVVLCLDEVQAMPVSTLEVLRLLTNLETEKRKLLQVVLFGQPELESLLAEASVRQLRQRITFAYRLPPMNRATLGLYVAHRLAVAQESGTCESPSQTRMASTTLFRRGALEVIYRCSAGIPRLVNVLSHKALLAAYGKGLYHVSRPCALAAARDTMAVQFDPLHLRKTRSVNWRPASWRECVRGRA